MRRSWLPALLVPGAAALLLGALSSGRAAPESSATEDPVLTKAGVAGDGPSLLEFFRKRVRAAHDRDWLQKLIKELGGPRFLARRRAARELVQVGPAARLLLKEAVKSNDLETSRRAGIILQALDEEPALPLAATRMLARLRPPGAVQVLLSYLPTVDGEDLEDEVIQALAAVGVSRGRIDPLIRKALKDKEPKRRGAAAFIAGQLGGLGQREAARRMLADPDVAVRQRAAQGLIGKNGYFLIEQSAGGDEDLVKHAGVTADGPGLLAFFRKRTLTEADRQHLRDLVRRLGAYSYHQRKRAARELVAAGSASLQYLKPALSDPDLEVVRRAEQCVRAIEAGPGTALPAAAARLLARRAPNDAVRTLLRYVPSAEDEDVEDSVLLALCALSVQRVELDPSLKEALADADPIRRGAAAYVLGRVGMPSDCAAVRRLLRDASPRVRLRAAQGLLFAQDRAAVPALVDGLARADTGPFALHLERLLRQLAGDQAPAEFLTEGPPAERQKARAAWLAWWHKSGGSADLARVSRQAFQLGLTVLTEFDGTIGGGRVWEFGRDFKPRWTIQPLQGPMDAHVLARDRVLICEYYPMRVTERDLKGAIKWEYKLTNYPIACQRLPNGNTFIATYTSLVEVTRDKKVVYDSARNDGQIFSAEKMRNGHVVYITSAGWVVEVEPRGNRVVHRFNVPNPGAWCGVESLPNGRLLVTLMATGEIREMDAAGKKVFWKASVPGAHQTLRLPNGNTLVVCMNTKRLVEINRAGKPVWERPTDGRPWRVHRR